VGRVDDQVKIRGYRIELGEIEAVLMDHPLVGEAVVIAREDQPGEKRLAAYYTAIEAANASEEIADAEQLRGHIAARLPEYMVPATFTLLEAMPLTGTGKLDRRALPAPRCSSSLQYRPPVTPKEATVCALFAEVLGLQQVGMDDDFFALGGHSLTVMQLLSRVREELGCELSWQTFCMKLSPAAVANYIGSHLLSLEPAPSAVPAWNRESTLLFPLSSSQKRVWFIHELDPDETAYRFAATISFRGPLDTAALQRALNLIVERHEILRTTFEVIDGEPLQHIHPFESFSIRRQNVPGSPDAASNSKLQDIIQEEITAAFRLDQLPLIRWTLLQFDAQEHMLVQVEHHLIHDGWSFNLFLSELTKAYAYYVGASGSSEHSNNGGDCTE